MSSKEGRLLGGVLLVTGTTVGGAVLALPVSTGLAGFIPSLLLFLVCWGYLTYTAFLLLEVNLWLKGDSNIVSMARHTVGLPGQALSWIAYLFLLYALTTAYLAVSGPLFIDFVQLVTGYHVPLWLGALPLLLIFGFFVYRGTEYVDFINRSLMLGLFVSYILLLGLLAPNIDLELLAHTDWTRSSMAASVIVTAFGFHIIIPSLSTYLGHRRSDLVKALVIGSIIPLLLYCVWEFFTMGVVPLEGEAGLLDAYRHGHPVTRSIAAILGNPWVTLAARFFEFCAVVTSFLGVSLSLSDFFADGFRIKKTAWGRFLLCLLTFVPPYLITVTNPRAFLTALEFAGVFGVVVLLGLLPALMVWWGRYHRGHKSDEFRAPGGRPVLALVIAVSLGLVVLEILNKIGVN